MNWTLFLFQSVWQDLLQGSQNLPCIWRAGSSGGFVPALWLPDSPRDVVFTKQSQNSLSDIYYVTPSAMTLTVGKVVSFWNLIIWVQYLLESVLSEWMESNIAEIWCSLGIFGSWELSSDFKAISTGSVWFCLNSEYWIQKLEPFLVWGFCFKTVTGLYTTFPWDI